MQESQKNPSKFNLLLSNEIQPKYANICKSKYQNYQHFQNYQNYQNIQKRLNLRLIVKTVYQNQWVQIPIKKTSSNQGDMVNLNLCDYS